jgi:CheY-like chemotaxis protein
MHSVLIIDDDRTARYGMRRALEESYKVFEAQSAEEARRIVATENPDLLLLDIEMPEENGLDFLRALKEGGDGRPVVREDRC